MIEPGSTPGSDCVTIITGVCATDMTRLFTLGAGIIVTTGANYRSTGEQTIQVALFAFNGSVSTGERKSCGKMIKLLLRESPRRVDQQTHC
jgi:hypothetical protein